MRPLVFSIKVTFQKSSTLFPVIVLQEMQFRNHNLWFKIGYYVFNVIAMD